MTWTTKSGKELDIDTMSTEHITNTLNYLLKHYGETQLDAREAHYDQEGGDDELIDQMRYMRKILMDRELQKKNKDVLERVDTINIFNMI